MLLDLDSYVAGVDLLRLLDLLHSQRAPSVLSMFVLYLAGSFCFH